MNEFESASSRQLSWTRRVFSALLAAMLLLPKVSFAVDTICAKVKIEITQELTMERQGFDAVKILRTCNSANNLITAVRLSQRAGKMRD